MKPKSGDKNHLQQELKSFLSTTHGEIKQAAEKISKALNNLIEKSSQQNKKALQDALKHAMTLPQSLHFKTIDKKVQQGLVGILEQAKAVILSDLDSLIALNEKIKQENKRLKERIKHVEQQRRGPAGRM